MRERDFEREIKENKLLQIPTCLDYLTFGDHGILNMWTLIFARGLVWGAEVRDSLSLCSISN